MTFRKIIIIIGFVFLSGFSLRAEEEVVQTTQGNQTQATESGAVAGQEADQQISEFSLAGYGERGKKNWDIAGKSADIFMDEVKLDTVVGNLYGEKENIQLTSDKGDFNKVTGKIHLEKNVVITSTSGTKLTTDTLDWDRKAQLVSTDDVVNIERDNIVSVGRGARGEPGLKKMVLKKDVRVNINPAEGENSNGPKEKVAISCDGPLEVDYEKNIATFENNVKVERPDSTISSDKMNIYFIAAKKENNGAQKEGQAGIGNKIDKIEAKGNVKVIRGQNLSFSQAATYTASDRRIVLTGRPKLIIYSTEDFKSASFGN